MLAFARLVTKRVAHPQKPAATVLQYVKLGAGMHPSSVRYSSDGRGGSKCRILYFVSELAPCSRLVHSSCTVHYVLRSCSLMYLVPLATRRPSRVCISVQTRFRLLSSRAPVPSYTKHTCKISSLQISEVMISGPRGNVAPV